MTEDTARALEIIKPMADELGITVYADDNFLYCGFHDITQPIGITFNSTYATLKEFVGYLASWLIYRNVLSWDGLEEHVKRHWVTLDKILSAQEDITT